MNNSDNHSFSTEKCLSVSRFPSFIIRLTSIDRVKLIMTSKRNYLSTRDLNKSVLSEELVYRMPYSKIFINESLSSSEHKNFKSLKTIAKKLGFRFIWHRGGKFLAWWNFGTPEHSFSNPSDLNAIKTAYVYELHKPLSNIITLPTQEDVNPTPHTSDVNPPLHITSRKD